MDVYKYLEQYNGDALKTFRNALSSNKFFHAYLLNGEPGTPLLEIAKFLAKSLICEDPTPFACNLCTNCERFDKGNFSNCHIIDAATNVIHKEEIENIMDAYSKTSFEKTNKQIYIINKIEEIDNKTISIMLKFLEEPKNDIYAIFTTENKYKVLPTILSRTQIINFKNINKQIILSQCKEKNIPLIDSELLSVIYNDANKIEEEKKNDNFLKIKKIYLDFFKHLDDNKKLRFYAENEVTQIKGQPNYKMFLDLLVFAFKEAINYKISNNTIFVGQENLYKILIERTDNLDDCLLKIVQARNEISINANIALLIVSLFGNLF